MALSTLGVLPLEVGGEADSGNKDASKFRHFSPATGICSHLLVSEVIVSNLP